ncbi:hypothetical protein ACOSQ3_026337 [Xanthoceras sorbifolium]
MAYSTFIITFFCILIALPASSGQDNPQACSLAYVCGPATLNIWYPFWGNGRPRYCGLEGFELKCQNNQYPIIESGPQMFRVSKIDTFLQTMNMARDDIWNSYCPGLLQETTLNKTLYNYMPDVIFLDLFYNCSGQFSLNESNSFSCGEGTGFYTNPSYVLQLPNLTNTCEKSIKVPVLRTALENHVQNKSDFQQTLNQGFDVEFQSDNTSCTPCFNSGGVCASNVSTSKFVCYCRGQPQPLKCDHSSASGSNLSSRLKISIGATAAVFGLTVIGIVSWLSRRKISSIVSSASLMKRTKDDQDLEAFIRNYGPLAIKRYKFSHLKKMTNSFKDELGQGGYGTVYKGKLEDGQIVAVKLLNASKGHGQEFINEVASINRTSHVNVVTLLGFCLEINKRALIYEFMPNGSLEKFIFSEDSLETSIHLGWEKLYQISLGIAKGLEYLHRGCSTRILHLDIKPHNILLDEDFCPKISDFGLAKLCPRTESIVSMSEARGTIGYIAPEIFSRNFGEVSHKSDVYSYGMMILEMAGGKNNPRLRMDNTSDIYFTEWIYRRFELGEEFKLGDTMTEEENEIAKKLVIVGLWCIQTKPMDRPSMNKVIEMLQGSIEALHFPPNPCVFSPPTCSPTVTGSSTISLL